MYIQNSLGRIKARGSEGVKNDLVCMCHIGHSKGLSIDLQAHVKAHQRGSMIFLNRVAYCKNNGIRPNCTLQWDKFIRFIIIVLIDRNH